MPAKKTHRDYIRIIGETAATAKGYREKRWNQYYFNTYKFVVDKMMGEIGEGKSVIDVGTSHGNWFSFLKFKGFKSIFGVELDSHRANLANQCGYTEVYNCDASNIPHPDSSIDYAVSNDVFLHILRRTDKVSVLKEVERILKPGGIFIFNHAMTRAFGFNNYTVDRHCSFIGLHELICLITNNSKLEIVDIKPTFYIFRKENSSLLRRIINYCIQLPLSVTLFSYMDFINSRRYPIEESDSIYIKLRKIN